MEREILGLMGAMNIKSEEKDNYVILRLKGQIDIYNAGNLEQIIEAFAGRSGNSLKNIILDFKEVNYLDSSAIACLIKCEGLSKEESFGKNLILINLNDKLSDLFKLAKVDSLFNILGSEEEAKHFKE